ncbi:PREDICTED: uncharacterized protein LOC104590865 [Nelumbo nucifera]|uniref:Uncharacterized protein LOC104590865 n=1 Tax=Nelumbo nucifera TaxID=4432 RepID=A0A1U7ZI52_NELNU|nr:PREDICTED: uncharacterized protein LOC104590865 [Nelumbo nucifera]
MHVTRYSKKGDLQFDPEIEGTLCRLRREARSHFEENDPVFDSLPVSGSALREEDIMAGNRTLKELAAPDLNQQPLCITFPALDADVNFELKSGLIHLLHIFHGLVGGDPHKYLKELHVVCTSMKPMGVTEEQIKLRAFPFSLKDSTKDWLYYLPSGSVTTWNEMKRLFLEKYFPASRVANIRKEICGNMQMVKACGICSTVGHPTNMCPTLQEEPVEQETKQFQQETRASIQRLDNQMGQMATTISQLEAQSSGKLPFQTVVKPKENVSAVVLRSGKEFETPARAAPAVSNQGKEKDIIPDDDEVPKRKFPPLSVYKPVPPFPNALVGTRKDEQFKEFYKTFRRCEANTPLFNALKQVPHYAKFLKELCTHMRKHKLKGCEKVRVGKNVSAVIKKLPTKCKDPNMFTIAYMIGNTRIKKAMLDLGASINVMPYSIYASLKLGHLNKTSVVIQLADRSNAYPKGIVEDVLVKEAFKLNAKDGLEIAISKHLEKEGPMLNADLQETIATLNGFPEL